MVQFTTHPKKHGKGDVSDVSDVYSLFDQNWCKRVDFPPIISLIVKVGLCAYQPAFNCFGALLVWWEVSWDAFSRHGTVDSLPCLGHCPDFYIRKYNIYFYVNYLKVLESTCCIIFCWFFVSVFFCRRFMARLEKDEMEALLRRQEQVVVKGWSHKAAHRQVRHSWVPQLRIREHTGNWCYLMEEIWELFKNSPNTRGIECIKLPISTGAPGIFVGSINSAALQ